MAVQASDNFYRPFFVCIGRQSWPYVFVFRTPIFHCDKL